MSGRRSLITSFFGAAVAVSATVVASTIILAPATLAKSGNYAATLGSAQSQFAKTELGAEVNLVHALTQPA